jgi:lipoprotein-anchoring transpeptidase ErfK/SrfK
MKLHRFIIVAAGFIFSTLFFTNCQNENIKKWRQKLNYKNLLAKIKPENKIEKSDTANILDNPDFDPASIDSTELISTIQTVYEGDSALIGKIGADDKKLLSQPIDSSQTAPISAKKDTFTNEIKKLDDKEILALKYNLDQLKKKVAEPVTDSILPTHKAAAVWCDVSKKDQRLYLYVEGECVDTFKVSTGGKGHTTPNIDRRPSGPSFSKYTSKKYPGGNYNGLGNMPYVLFVQGGYGLHGTTNGNIPKLGNPASHGCVRLHPNNAKIIFELSKAVGVENMWVTIRE